MSPTLTPLFGGIPAGPEVLLIVVVVILLFGANKIPELARSTGQAMGEFQKGRQQIEEELEEMQEGPDQSETPTDEQPSGSEPSTAQQTDTTAETDS